MITVRTKFGFIKLHNIKKNFKREMSKMIIHIDAKKQLLKQLESFYSVEASEIAAINAIYEETIGTLAQTFKYINNKYYQCGGGSHSLIHYILDNGQCSYTRLRIN